MVAGVSISTGDDRFWYREWWFPIMGRIIRIIMEKARAKQVVITGFLYFLNNMVLLIRKAIIIIVYVRRFNSCPNNINFSLPSYGFKFVISRVSYSDSDGRLFLISCNSLSNSWWRQTHSIRRSSNSLYQLSWIIILNVMWRTMMTVRTMIIIIENRNFWWTIIREW